jgi:hypothetical protein
LLAAEAVLAIELAAVALAVLFKVLLRLICWLQFLLLLALVALVAWQVQTPPLLAQQQPSVVAGEHSPARI